MWTTIFIIILIGIILFLGWVIYLMTEQLEQIENNIGVYEEYYNAFIEQLNEANQKMQAIDNKGSFSSDDEIGFAFKTVRDCIDDLVQMGVITYDEEADSGEEVQGEEEEE